MNTPKTKFRRLIVPTMVLLTALLSLIFSPDRRPEQSVKNETLEVHLEKTPANPRNGPLFGYVVILDAGHGGLDPGSHGKFRGKEVYEAPYVMDVTRRVAPLLKERGAIVLFTRSTPTISGPSNAPPDQVLPLTRNDKFTADDSQVRAGIAGLERRLWIARKAKRDYPKHRPVFVSIHFDAEPSKLKGVYVIVPAGKKPKVARTLVQAFGEVKRLRQRQEGKDWKEYHPVLTNGSARNLYILREDKNPIAEKVLIELGNFGNKDDVWRIRSADIRQQYAEGIVAGLERLNP